MASIAINPNTNSLPTILRIALGCIINNNRVSMESVEQTAPPALLARLFFLNLLFDRGIGQI